MNESESSFRSSQSVWVSILVGLAVGLFLAAVTLAWLLHHVIGLTAGLLAAALCGAGAGSLVHRLRRLRHTHRRTDAELADTSRQLGTLSQFHVANPNPLMKFSAEGELLYRNPASAGVLDELGFAPDDVEHILPEAYREWITDALAGRRLLDEMETRLPEGRTLRYNISPFPTEEAVLLAGRDVTQLKRLERDLRRLNDTLEERVDERTIELLLTQDVTIMSLATLAGQRDKETGAHLERTRAYVKVLADHLKDHPRFREFLCQPRMVEHLHRSTPLHDIGKVGIPDAILLKPGRLEPVGYEEMKKHTILGGDALDWAEKRLGRDSFLAVARQIAYHHHERWDGAGYPHGLKGDEIPIPARLMAVADVYDALISERCYKPAFSHEEACRIILDGRGSHFDPDIADAFNACEEEFHHIAIETKEPA